MKTSVIDLRKMTLNQSYRPKKVQSNKKERSSAIVRKKKRGKNDYATFVFILATLEKKKKNPIGVWT